MNPRERRLLLVLLILGLGAAAFFLFGQGLLDGDGGADEVAAPTPTVSPPPISTPPPDDIIETIPPRFSFFAGRNPFLPLVVGPEGTGGGTSQPPQQSGGGGGGGGGGEEQHPPPAPPPPSGDEDGGGGGGDGGSSQGTNTRTVDGQRVTLVDVFSSDGKERAQVKVDSKTYVVEEGASFGDNFKVVSIEGSCASFLHGDERFTLCT